MVGSIISEDFALVTWAISEILLMLRSIYFPLYLFGEFSVGYGYEDWWGVIDYYPSTGTIYSYGMLAKTYSGNFYGQIRSFIPCQMGPVGYEIFYSGIVGFTGLNIRISGGNFLIGSCVMIDLGPSPP